MFSTTGRAADVSTLTPRRRGELPRAVYAKSRGTREGAAPAFHGRYVGEMTQFGEAPEPFPVEVILQRRGNRVNGHYNFGLGTGTVEGIASSDALHFEWVWTGNLGRGVFKSRSDGTAFSGTWGYRRAVDNAGTWKGRRTD